MEANTAAKIVVFCNLVLVLKYFATIIFQGVRRTRAPEDGFQPPVIANEAKEPLQKGNDSETNRFEFSEEKRWQRIVMNDLENVPMGILMMWVSLLVGGQFTVTAIAALIFAFARVCHTICYVWRLMPWRAFAWLFGVLSTLTLTANSVYGVFQNSDNMFSS